MAKKKWQDYKGILPTYQPEVESSWLEKVLLIKEELGGKKNTEIGTELESLKYKKKEIEVNLSELNAEIEARESVMIERFEMEGVQSFKLASGTSFYLSQEPYSRITDKNAVRSWLKENGMEELLTVHFQTLNSLVKDLLEAGQPEPQGVSVFLRSSMRMRRG